MIIDLIFVGLLLASAVALFLLVGRKLAILGSVDLEHVPERKAGEIKQQLLEERFLRNFRRLAFWLRRVLRPVASYAHEQRLRVVGRLKELENHYALPSSAAPTEAVAAKVAQLLNEARAYFEDDQLAEAEKKCIEAVSLNQREPSAFRLLGDIYRLQKDYVHAREVYEFLLQLNVQDADAHVGLGRVAADEGSWEAAAAEYSKSLEIADQASVHLDLTDVYLKLGDEQRALTTVQDALALDPNNPKILDRFLTLALEQGKSDLAGDALQKLKEVNPENQKLSLFEEQLEKIRKGE